MLEMALRVEEKKALVAEVARLRRPRSRRWLPSIAGSRSAKLTQLRAKARASGVYVRVVKNTLARRAIAGTQFECVKAPA